MAITYKYPKPQVTAIPQYFHQAPADVSGGTCDENCLLFDIYSGTHY
jgi:hypothetical protein